MQVFHGISSFHSEKKIALTIGTFDGVHLGHQGILNRLKHEALRINGEAVLLTFHPHPRAIVKGSKDEGVRLLQTIEEKSEKLKNSGIDKLIIQPFDQEFSKQTATFFVEEILINKLQTNVLIIGYDHRFGNAREGDIMLLRKYAQKGTFKVIEIDAVESQEINVSSTKIREAISEGEMELAGSLLNEPYFIQGKVVHGDKRGASLGFKTANIELLNTNKIVPKNGVYMVQVIYLGKTLYGLCNIGVKPTFGEGLNKSMEVHLLNFNQNIYGETLQICFFKKVRNEQPFPNKEALIRQINQDIEHAKSYFNLT